MSNFGTYGFPKKNYESSLSQSSGVVSLTANDNFMVGDIVTNIDGLIKKPFTNFPEMSTVTNTALGTIYVTNNGVGQGALSTFCPLNDGSQVFASYNTFTIYNSSNSQIVNNITIDTGITSTSMKTLSNGNFVIAYTNATAVKFAIYSSTGTLVKAPTIVASTVSARVYVTCNTNGFIICWRPPTPFYPTYAIYNNKGTQLLAPTVVVGAVACTLVKALYLSDGRYIIMYLDTTATFVKYMLYNTSNVAQGSLVSLNATASLQFDVLLQSDGGFSVLFVSSSYCFIEKQNSSFTKIVTYKILGTSDAITTNLSLLPLPNDDMMALQMAYGSYIYYTKMSSSCVQISQLTTISIASMIVPVVATALTSGNIVFTHTTSTATFQKLYVYGTNSMTILGVAQNNASIGEVVNVIFAGEDSTYSTTVPINTDYGNVAVPFDHTSKGGCKGVFIGKSCVLKGV